MAGNDRPLPMQSSTTGRRIVRRPASGSPMPDPRERRVLRARASGPLWSFPRKHVLAEAGAGIHALRERGCLSRLDFVGLRLPGSAGVPPASGRDRNASSPAACATCAPPGMSRRRRAVPAGLLAALVSQAAPGDLVGRDATRPPRGEPRPRAHRPRASRSTRPDPRPAAGAAAGEPCAGAGPRRGAGRRAGWPPRGESGRWPTTTATPPKRPSTCWASSARRRRRNYEE